MKALDQSDALIRRGNELRARSERMRAAAEEKMAKSRRLIAVAAEICEAFAAPPRLAAARAQEEGCSSSTHL